EIDVMPPRMIVAGHTHPSPSTASESKKRMSGKPDSRLPRWPIEKLPPLSSPGAVTSHHHTRAVVVSATYTRVPSGDRPTPLGVMSSWAPRRIDEPSADA